uniref:SLAM family member 8 n=1 Tax=Pelusios castaneus TaxID=367368 RepID=A0A8C8SBB0_9SAUR
MAACVLGKKALGKVTPKGGWERLWGLFSPAAARAAVQVTGVVGRAVSLGANVPPGFQIRDAFWRYLAPAEEIVATYFRGSTETLYQSRFHGRSRLQGNLTLEISQVELGDSGTFSVLLVDTRGQTLTRTLHLAVYEVVSQLTLQVFTSESSRSGSAEACEVFLTCMAAGGTNVTYSWARTDGKVLSMDKHSLYEVGRVLWAKLDPSERQVSYTCSAVNAVSRDSATVTPWEHCQRKTGTSYFTHAQTPGMSQWPSCLQSWILWEVIYIRQQICPSVKVEEVVWVPIALPGWCIFTRGSFCGRRSGRPPRALSSKGPLRLPQKL